MAGMQWAAGLATIRVAVDRMTEEWLIVPYRQTDTRLTTGARLS